MAEQISLGSNLHAGSVWAGVERALGAADAALAHSIAMGRLAAEGLLQAPRLARVGVAGTALVGAGVLNTLDPSRPDRIMQREQMKQYAGTKSFNSILVLGTFGEETNRRERDGIADAVLGAAEESYDIRTDMLLGVWVMESQRQSSGKRRSALEESARALRRRIIGRYGLHMLAGEEPIKVSQPEHRLARQQISPYEQLYRAACEVKIEAENNGMPHAPVGVLIMVDERRALRMLGVKESLLRAGGTVALERVGKSIHDLEWRGLNPETLVSKDEQRWPHRERRFTHAGTDRRRGERRSDHAVRSRQTERGGVS